MVKSAQALAGLIVCRDTTGALSTPTVGPTGTLYVDGVSNAASVTITGANPYKWAVTLPTLTVGQSVQVYITATIATIATAAIVFEDIGDTALASDNAATLGAAGAGLTSIPNSAGVGTLLTRLPQILQMTHIGSYYYAAVDLFALLGVAIAGTAAQISAAFTKFFDKASPTGTINSLPDAVAGAANGLPTTNGTKVNQTVDLTSGQSIAVSDKTGFSLSVAGILAIWNQLTTDAGIVANSFGAKLRDLAMTAAGKVTAILNRWLTDDAAGTPLALTNANLVQADAIKEAGAVPNNLGGTAQSGDAYSLLGTKIPQTIEFSHVGLHYYIAIDLQSWLGVIPAALTATGKFIQSMVDRWITDDAAGTPLALTGAFKVQADAGSFGTLPTLGTDSRVLISADTQDLSGSLSVNIGKWLGVVPAVLSATDKFIQAMVMRWKTDDAPGTPDALSSGKLPADVKLWLTAAPDALSSGKVPSDVKLWLTGVPDALSSGKIPADLKLWLASAPAAVTANGYVQTTVLRWLTDNAAGTPLALTAAWLLQVNAVAGGATPQQIWDALLTNLTTPNSIGALLSQFVFTIAGQVDANAVTGGGGGGITAIDVWNELLAGMIVPNSVGDLMANLTTVIDTALSLTHGAGLWGGSMGTGSVLYVPDRATDPLHVPLDGVNTWVTTDLTDPTIGLVARAYTDAFGMIVPGFMLDPGDYAVWRQRAGDTFINPQLIHI